MRSRLSATLLTMSVAIGAASCAQPPTTRVDAAKAELQQLPAEAATYAAGALKAAQDAAAQLDAELAARAGDYFPSYDRAGQLAAALEEATAKVAPAIVEGKQRARTETARMVTDTRRALTEAGQTIEAMTARHASADQRKEWQAAAAAATTTLDDADKLLASGDLPAARRQAEAAGKAAAPVTSAVAAIQVEIEAARQAAAEQAAQGDVTLERNVLADGQRLAAGSYMLRLGDEVKTPAGGTERWVEFTRSGKVAGRALAVMVPDAEIRQVAKSAGPRDGARVELLKGGEYYRVWLNRGGVNYLIHLPPPAR